MAYIEELHVGDIGTVIRATVNDTDSAGAVSVFNVSGALTKDLIFRKPDGTKLTKNASFYTDGTDGKLQYTTISGDLDTAGSWNIQAYIVMPSGTWYSSVGSFKVYENL